MRCKDYSEMISLYIDDKLDESGKEKLSEHLETCKACKAEYEELLAVRKILQETPIEELPEGFKEELHVKLLNYREEELEEPKIKPMPIKKNRRFNWKAFSAIAALLLIMVISVVSLGELGFKSGNEMTQDNAVREEYGNSEMKIAAPEIAVAPSEVPDLALIEERGLDNNQLSIAGDTEGKAITDTSPRKIILNGFLQIDVEDFDAIYEKIIDITVSKGGFIQSSNTRYKYFNRNKPEESLKEGNLTLRVPETEFYNILQEIKELGNVIDSRINTSDITGEYRDTVNELENLKVQEERLRGIMEKATNVSEVLEVERELNRVRGEINRLTGNIKTWDNLVSLSTIEVYLNQISHGDLSIDTIDDGIWTRAKKGFIRTINNLINITEELVIKFVSLIPIVIIIGVLLGFLYLILRKLRNKKMEG